ncbi:unnamed protein product [Adineta steineri]|uniref:Uncharacterized protein n=1 Tax=Adineta steineri TaxID=433720 RepID=A0A818I9W7_9BILA|nr:unnamed protein product [Adineta steineri]CAF3520179.1 unnamed protein product [Adineta steineri]
MYAGFGLFLFIICFILLTHINQSFHHHSHDDIFLDRILISSTNVEPILFFQNEPIPIASSVVDDLTTLASAIYIISFIIIIFILLAWITHYNAPCSSLITSILSTITGLPEPIIHSVALCGSCCVWCEKTWLFRRIHQFNIWISNKIKQFLSVTCKVLYDTVCPCCQPPDTPSNRSIIGSLPASIIAMINMPDTSHSLSSKPSVTIVEPTSVSSEPSIEIQDSKTSRIRSVKTIVNAHQIDENKSIRKKQYKRSRRQVALQQQSIIDKPSHVAEDKYYQRTES